MKFWLFRGNVGGSKGAWLDAEARRHSDASPPKRRSNDEEVYQMLQRLQWAALCGCVLIILFSAQFWKSGFFFRITATGIVIAGASAFLGFLLGFVFCIPRTTKESDAMATASSKPPEGVERDAAARSVALARSNIETNTNLVDISDWLTKILVGVGLVELNRIPDGLKRLAAYLGGGLRECESGACIQSSEAFALSIVVFFAGAGFLIGYLWTRMYFQNALEDLHRTRADLDRARKDLGRKDAYWSDIAAEASNVERLIGEKQFDEAIQIADEAIRQNPENAAWFMIRGRALKRKAQAVGAENEGEKKYLLEEALKSAMKAAELMPERGGPRYNVACYQALLGHVEHAEILKNLRRAFALNPKLVVEAKQDPDLASLNEDEDFKRLTRG